MSIDAGSDAVLLESGGMRGYVRRRSGHSAPGVVGAVLLTVLLALLILGPALWRLSSEQQDLANAFASPSADHLLGTDHLGRDLLARFLAGGRVDLFMSSVSGLLSLFAGLTIGIVAALYGGIVETVCMRLVDSLLALPGIVQAVILVAVVGRGMAPLIVALAVYAIPIFARVIHAATRQVMTEDYYAAARVLGCGPLLIVFRHVVPNIVGPVLVLVSLQIGANINIAAALNFFGLGIQPPAAAWGLMIEEGNRYSFDNPFLLIVPGLGLFIAGLAFNFLGDGLRDWLDPRESGQ